MDDKDRPDGKPGMLRTAWLLSKRFPGRPGRYDIEVAWVDFGSPMENEMRALDGSMVISVFGEDLGKGKLLQSSRFRGTGVPKEDFHLVSDRVDHVSFFVANINSQRGWTRVWLVDPITLRARVARFSAKSSGVSDYVIGGLTEALCRGVIIEQLPGQYAAVPRSRLLKVVWRYDRQANAFTMRWRR